MKLNGLFILILVFSLTACSAMPQTTTQPLPTVVLGQDAPGGATAPTRPAAQGAGGNGVVASGVVIPAQEAQLVFPLSGQAETVAVTVGATVKAGDILARIQGKEDLQAAVVAAELELAVSQKALEDLKQNASGARTAALKRISAATQAVRDATYQLDNFTVPTDQADLETRQALEQTEAELNEARIAFKPYRGYPSSNSLRQDLKERLDNAQAAYNAAVRRLEYETELEVARSELQEALHDFELWDKGPNPAELSLAEKRVTNAQAAADAAHAQLNSLELRAPFAGSIAKVNVHSGEWVIAGQSVIEMADLGHLRVETTDLSERDIPSVTVGQPVTVLIEALNEEVPGHVAEISPLADTLGGDVVYHTILDLDSLPEGLRAGMSVEVRFGSQ